ncbi:inositol monophosphatase family protein [Agromyces sp. Leaf222]|uniref:inositol monophosphatase family protein n=1 Tax=Agromyces sp. Leaf222 TaxID=1735688 RepID=UPI0006FC1FD8|nr:inositol monophosphatase family protein [Agromyces sp. Leaf222]KQM82320.1 inositol monophosphatase [Agromyces sp. Leaf222]
MTSAAASADLLELAHGIAVRAGAFALEARGHGVSVAATKSTPTDVVTAVDRDTEALIRSLILDARPHDGIVGEEDAAHIGTSGLDWIVDPIDGTVNFLYGIPSWAVSIGVAERGGADAASGPGGIEGTTLAGVVLNPVSGELSEASLGGGASSAGRRLAVNDGVPLHQALVATGFGYATDVRRRQAEVLLGVLPEVRDIRRIGSAALDLAALAAGRLDAYYERGLNAWDHAAGGLIAREAGAVVTGPRGGRENSELLVAAAPGLHAELVALLRRAGVDA